MRSAKAMIGFTLGVILFFLAGAYIYRQSAPFLKGPIIELDNTPTNPLSQSLFEVSGKASNVAFLSLNGSQIYTDEEGAFKEKLLLLSGYNIIQLKARDKFGREHLRTIQAVYTSSEKATTTPIN